MKKTYTILLISLLGIIFSGCDDFLSEKPNKSTSVVPETVEHLEMLLNNLETFATETSPAVTYASDSYGVITDIASFGYSIPGLNGAQYATWDNQYTRMDQFDTFFSGEYNKIFIANMVLYYLPIVYGDDDVKAKLELEAKFIRAYSLWTLAQTYCLPYTEENKDELGLTIKKSTSFEESSARATLEATYQAIEKDLQDALGITSDMPLIGKKYRSWRASKAAVNAFAARYWLNRNDYAKALNYATTALASHDKLMDYNTKMRYSNIPNTYPVNGVDVDVLFPYTYDQDSYEPTYRLEWQEIMYYRMQENGDWWYIPSRELLDIYDKEYDLRYKYRIVDNKSYYWGIYEVEYPGYVFFYLSDVPSGPTTAEMLLIKAECLARDNYVADAMVEVNKLRDARMDISAPAEKKYLSTTDKDEAIKLIIQERWREMPFSQRWNDMRRLNHNEDPKDDIGTVERIFYPYNASMYHTDQPVQSYKLEPGSRKYALPIPQVEIDASLGVIEQNIY